jgi:hypothetical protein
MPCSATNPRREKAVVSLAPSAAKRMSHISACTSPIPALAPLMAATIGLGIDRGKVCERGSRRSSPPRRTPTALRSRPLPAPASTRSADRGRLSVSTATPSWTDFRTTSLMSSPHIVGPLAYPAPFALRRDTHHLVRAHPPCNPSNRAALSLSTRWRTSSRIGSFSKSASQRSGVSIGKSDPNSILSLSKVFV